eukprot:3933055-Rhodomonas_salina.1
MINQTCVSRGATQINQQYPIWIRRAGQGFTTFDYFLDFRQSPISCTHLENSGNTEIKVEETGGISCLLAAVFCAKDFVGKRTPCWNASYVCRRHRNVLMERMAARLAIESSVACLLLTSSIQRSHPRGKRSRRGVLSRGSLESRETTAQARMGLARGKRAGGRRRLPQRFVGWSGEELCVDRYTVGRRYQIKSLTWRQIVGSRTNTTSTTS